MGSPVIITPDQASAPPVTITPDPPPSAASRFAGSFARGAGVVSSEEGKNFFTHPVDTAKGMLESQGELGARAYQEFKSGDLAHAFQHGIEYLLPGLGPTLAHSGEQLESGDIAGGVGTTLGAGTTIAAGTPEGRGAIASSFENAKPMAQAAVRATGGTLNNPVAGPIIGAATGELMGGHGVAGAIAGHAARGLLSKVFTKMEGIGIKPPVSAAPEPVFPSSPPTAAVPTEIQQAVGLRNLPETGASPASATGEALAQMPQRGAIAKAQAGPAEMSLQEGKQIVRKSLQRMLQDSMGGRDLSPTTPLRDQLDVAPPKATQPDINLPEGHTAFDSSAVRSGRYDAAAKEYHVRGTSGDTTYVYGDVSPDAAQAFEQAESKGKAWQTMKNNPLVAKIVNGKRIAIKPAAK